MPPANNDLMSGTAGRRPDSLDMPGPTAKTAPSAETRANSPEKQRVIGAIMQAWRQEWEKDVVSVTNLETALETTPGVQRVEFDPDAKLLMIIHTDSGIFLLPSQPYFDLAEDWYTPDKSVGRFAQIIGITKITELSQDSSGRYSIKSKGSAEITDPKV